MYPLVFIHNFSNFNFFFISSCKCFFQVKQVLNIYFNQKLRKKHITVDICISKRAIHTPIILNYWENARVCFLIKVTFMLNSIT